MGGDCSCCSSDEEKLKQETEKAPLTKRKDETDKNKGPGYEIPTKRGSPLSDHYHGFVEGSFSPPLPDPGSSQSIHQRLRHLISTKKLPNFNPFCILTFMFQIFANQFNPIILNW